MTLFEAIRELKEGQAIEERMPGGPYLNRAIEWEHEGEGPRIFAGYIDGRNDFRIIDLPKPKMSLEEGLARLLRNELVQVTITDNEIPLFGLLHGEDVIACSLKYLRSLPIDWQAEADRKEGKA